MTATKKQVSKKSARIRRHKKVRAKISGTDTRPRVAVYRSNAHIYVQVVNDSLGKTILGRSDAKLTGTKTERANQLGKTVGEEIIKMGIKTALFDRGGYKYHGRVLNIAEGLRSSGLIL